MLEFLIEAGFRIILPLALLPAMLVVATPVVISAPLTKRDPYWRGVQAGYQFVFELWMGNCEHLFGALG